MAILRQIITLTAQQYETLISGQPLIVGDKVYRYNENTLYVVPDEEEVQFEQADWNQKDPTANSYIKNKPTIPNIIANTTDYWQRNFSIPPANTIIIYTDAQSITTEQGETIYIPSIKISDGTTPVTDLPFTAAQSLSSSVKYNTTAYWNAQGNYIPAAGQIIVYSDKDIITIGGEQKNIPAIKIGDGSSYLIDLPFSFENTAIQLQEHISDDTIHITAEQRIFWNNKLNLEDMVQNQTLHLNRR